ncbi:MAG: sigma 54-interacting transcriptional regulator [Clostridiales bacterium]|nr:sigma 54-interacting transcriptional regulator [Clostridiales bacterium]
MQKLREYAQEVLNLYNYFNGAIIFDQNAVAVYYYNNRQDINNLTEEDVVGKHLSQIYPNLDLSSSTIIEALTKGIPTSNKAQRVKTFKGRELNEVNTTIPIFENDNIIGAVEVSKYIIGDEPHQNIFVTPVTMGQHRQLYTADDIISDCIQLQEVKRKIKKVAQTDSSVLIFGKTGTGKEMVAESIHTGGKRKAKRFISQNCAAIPASLLESILFGTVKGSFTGAENRIGLLESADGGTLFLDEINNMDLSIQAKILKAIEEQRITRVGDYESKLIDVRIIAATNQDPWQLVKDMRLREDLYYRLRVVQIDLPLLSERKGDIDLLTKYFIKKYNKRMGKNVMGLNGETERFFHTYPWPGNVRELENTVAGAFNFVEGHFIKLQDISWYDGGKEMEDDDFCDRFLTGGTLKDMVRNYEKHLIEEAMRQSADLPQVAQKLGITRQNLNHKMKQYHLQMPAGK